MSSMNYAFISCIMRLFLVSMVVSSPDFSSDTYRR